MFLRSKAIAILLTAHSARSVSNISCGSLATSSCFALGVFFLRVCQVYLSKFSLVACVGRERMDLSSQGHVCCTVAKMTTHDA